MSSTTHTIEVGDDEIDVVFRAHVFVGNDSFSHEFGTQRYPDYTYIEEDPEWNRAIYTPEQNAAIERYISDEANFKKVEKEIRREYEQWKLCI